MILIIMDEILKGICEHCMTPNFVYHRAIFVLRILFRLIGSGLIGQLIEKSDLRLWALIRVQPFPFCSGKQNWGSLSGDCQRGKFAPSSERGTVSNHIEKIRCLNAPVWHNASTGECESCGVV